MNQGQTGVRAPFALHVRVKIAPDGDVRASGTIRILENSVSGPSIPPLVAAAQQVDATCADVDRDGGSGLARLEAEFRTAKTAERVRVVLELTEHDVDAAGVYTAALHLGEVTLTGDTRFRIAGDGPSRQGRHAG